MKITLFHHPATRSARVAWLLHELGENVDSAIVRVDLYRDEQHRPDYLARFPLHAVPAIEIVTDEGETVTMTESGAIIVALADAFPDAGLAPPPAPFSEARAEYLSLIHACGASFDMMLWQIRIHEHILEPEQSDDRTIDRYRHKFVAEVQPMLARRLATREFVCGDVFTAADCMVAHALVWARLYGLAQEESIAAYLSRIAERPAFQRAFADAQDFDLLVPRGTSKSLFTG